MNEIKGKINFNIKYKKCIVNGCYNNVHCGGKYYKWNLSSSGYVYCRNNNIFLHNLLLDLDIKDIDNNNINIDHINHNRLDNRKENLRYVTRSFNNANRNQKCYSTVDGKYVVTTKIDGILHIIGKYNTEEEAISAREEWFKNNNTIYN